jgi:hypothetical protein
VNAKKPKVASTREALLSDPGTLFVSCNPAAGPVRRYGSASMIGATRDPKTPKIVAYDPEAVIMIPGDEAREYAREYRKAIASKDLIKRTRANFEAAERKAEAAELKRIEARKAEKAEAKKAATESPKQDGAPSAAAEPKTEER